MQAPVIGPDGLSIVGVAVPNQSGRPLQMPAPAIAVTTPFKPADERAAGEEMAGDGTTRENDLDGEDDDENWLSVAAIEAELKPKAIETFGNIAGTYQRLRRLQDRDVQFRLRRIRSRLRKSASTGGSKTK